jgi:hypothetical protein
MYKRLPYLALVCLMLLAIPSKAGPPGAVVQGWNYDAVKNMLTVHVVNTSNKEITVYNLSVTVKFTDGTQSTSEIYNDYLPLMASIKVSPGLSAKYGNGAFIPGASRDEIILNTAPKPVSNVIADVDLVAYSDGLVDGSNKRALGHILARRKGELLALQKANQIIKQSPDRKTAAAGLKRLADVAHAENGSQPEGNMEVTLRGMADNIGATSLADLAAENDAKIAFITPHTQLKEGGNQ